MKVKLLIKMLMYYFIGKEGFNIDQKLNFLEFMKFYFIKKNIFDY